MLTPERPERRLDRAFLPWEAPMLVFGMRAEHAIPASLKFRPNQVELRGLQVPVANVSEVHPERVAPSVELVVRRRAMPAVMVWCYPEALFWAIFLITSIATNLM